MAKNKKTENYEEKERVAKYPRSVAHDPNCSPEPEWSFEFENKEEYFWICLGCYYELVTDINGNTLVNDSRLW